MKKAFKFFGVFVVLILVYAAYDGYRFYRNNKVVFHYNFEKGESFTVQKEQEYLSQITEGEGAGSGDMTNATYRVTFTVNDITDSGIATIAAKVNQYEIKKSSSYGLTGLIGSAQTDEMSTLLNNAILSPFMLEVTKRGEVLKVLNFGEIEENFFGEAPEEMMDTPEKAEMLESLLTLYVGTEETVKDVLFNGYFRTWPEEAITAGKEWVHTEKKQTPGAMVDIRTAYKHLGSSKIERIDVSYTETHDNPQSAIPGVEAVFSNQNSEGFIEYHKDASYPPIQLHKGSYEIEQFVTIGEGRKQLAKVIVKTQSRIYAGKELQYKDLETVSDSRQELIDDIQKSLAAQQVVDDAVRDAEAAIEALPDPAMELQKAQKIMDNIGVLEQQMQQEKKYQDMVKALGEQSWKDVKPDDQ